MYVDRRSILIGVVGLLSNILVGNSTPIVLDSALLKIIDGNFMNASRMESVVFMMNRIIDTMNGKKQPDGSRVGLYTLNGVMVTMSDLIVEEEGLLSIVNEGAVLSDVQQNTINQIKSQLQRSKAAFMEISQPLSAQTHSMKDVFIRLIADSLHKRGRNGANALLTWAHLDPAEEKASFDNSMLTCKEYGVFLTDLFNFLTDMAHSCPKAWQQFKIRAEKLSKIKKMLPEAIARLKVTINENAFMSLVHTKYVDNLFIEDITIDLVCTLVKSSMQTKD